MFRLRLQSDQLYTWSERHAERAHCRIAQTSQSSSAPTAHTQCDPARLPDRALQTLRKTRMQMRRRSRSWPQVLSLGQLPGLSTANGLCAARVLRADRRVHRQLPPSPGDLRGDLRDQPRAATAPRGALRNSDGRCTLLAHRTIRNGIRRRAPGQYARSLARRRTKSLGSDRGIR
jgi:hypothetical protein